MPKKSSKVKSDKEKLSDAQRLEIIIAEIKSLERLVIER